MSDGVRWASRSSTGTVRIRMHNKLAALVVLGKYLGMFDERPQNTNAVYAISDKPMTNDEWVSVTSPHIENEWGLAGGGRRSGQAFWSGKALG
jgi:hypothetical protein